MIQITDYAQTDNQFYPTPNHIAEKMLADINLYEVNTILEPSAGKGNIVQSIEDKLIKMSNSYFSEQKLKYIKQWSIDCIEIDPHLRAILKDTVCKKYKNARVVYDDFLKFNTYKKYDLIIMNPPFKDGHKHLLKALEMQKNGGSIICLLNANTLRNPHNILQQELVKILEKYNADIKYIEDGFSAAERKADVDIALVKVYIEPAKQESDIYNNMKKAANVENESPENITDLDVTDFIKMITAHFKVEAGAGAELIKQYNTLVEVMKKSL